ncbi:MAG: DNA repair protein RadC [Oscillospiraceae bacterium]|nr:DNA repair protein RadC [Oscillospiraceae bacterium]
MAGDNPHKGHRGRAREQFRVRGLEGMADHQALELLLFYAIPRGDVNALAHRLLDTFGSLPGVFHASYENLLQVEGVGEHTAVLIRLMPALGQRYQQRLNQTGDVLDTTERLGAYLAPEFFGQSRESLVLLCLDARRKVLLCRRLSEGSLDGVAFHARSALEAALSCGAAQVVLAHNHLSGFAVPSREDVTATRQAMAAFAQAGIYLLDHLVFSGDDFVSMRDTGILQTLE